jgi:hypothetical protein
MNRSGDLDQHSICVQKIPKPPPKKDLCPIRVQKIPKPQAKKNPCPIPPIRVPKNPLHLPKIPQNDSAP